MTSLNIDESTRFHQIIKLKASSIIPDGPLYTIANNS